MNIIKIGYFADGPWSHTAFDLLIKDDAIDIKFIVPRTDTKDSTLLCNSKKHGIDYLSNSNINSPEFIEKAKSYNCDLFVSMSFNQIFKTEIINIPRLRTINCHAGKLPFYRGRNILNWVLINDEKNFGITVHYIDEGIDTGDIILQRNYPITDNDSYKTLLEVAYIECANILYDAVKLIYEAKVQAIIQNSIHPVGFYCGQRGEGDEIIDWNQSSRELFNFIRSICEPGPKARTKCKGKEVKINKSKLIENALVYKSTIGQVVGKSNKSIIVKTKDTILEITDYEYDGIIKIGDRFE